MKKIGYFIVLILLIICMPIFVEMAVNEIRDLFKRFCQEVRWHKVKLTKADKYHMRGKYFKVDFDLFDY